MKIIIIQIVSIILTKLLLPVMGGPSTEQRKNNNPEVWSFNLPDLPGQLGAINTNNQNFINKRQDDDEDDPSFRDAVTTYGRNRWNNFRNSFVEFWDIVRAGGRGIRGWFVSDND
ncbi:uncharacterized protein LOC128390736 [Panonychus citri]|uniref:uncharacterized protein LOC128390387 n=1 Tax=Panonychus citri TaxID=50023 RepID=UPI002308186D|nr:uncharacterized protein LOC128390387 [Panonychus citri]XP_053206468.1 uncharacterized protein LOC128390736 [Panonychus citri]